MSELGDTELFSELLEKYLPTDDTDIPESEENDKDRLQRKLNILKSEKWIVLIDNPYELELIDLESVLISENTLKYERTIVRRGEEARVIFFKTQDPESKNLTGIERIEASILAEGAFKNGEYNTAIGGFKQQLHHNPIPDIATILWIRDCYMNIEKYHPARMYATLAVIIQPNNKCFVDTLRNIENRIYRNNNEMITENRYNGKNLCWVDVRIVYACAKNPKLLTNYGVSEEEISKNHIQP